VFSTATQPAFDHLHSNVVRLNPAGWQPHEIVQNFHHMFNVAAQRTKVTWRYDQPVEVCDLANELIPHDQVLGIVNLKRHAVELAKILQQSGAPGLYHLSTNMCPAHRRDVLDEVQGPLDKNRPVRLIATQCVEAGVDLDFPIVYRALAPLDALAQAAGRCNRHGRHSKPGKVVIFQFVSDGRSLFPPGYKEGVQATEIFLNNLKTKYADLDGVDIFNNPELLRSYYKQFYDLTGHGAGTRDDEENLLRTIQEGDFEKVAQLYKLIDQDQINILVPYNQDKFEQLLRQMQPEERRNLETIRRWIGQARPYTVSLFRPGQKSPVWSYIAPIQFSKHDERRGDEAHWFYLLPTAQYDNLLGIMFPEELIF